MAARSEAEVNLLLVYKSPARQGELLTKVSVGDVHSLAIDLNGEGYSWGGQTFASLGRNGIPAVAMRL